MQLTKKDILLNQQFQNKEEAIRASGELLYKQGYIEKPYIEAMIERDKMMTTFIGNMVAIPHGTDQSKAAIKKSGIVILQVPEGVLFDGNETKVIIGIAGKGSEHMELLSNIAIICAEKENVEEIIRAQDENAIISRFCQEEIK